MVISTTLSDENHAAYGNGRDGLDTLAGIAVSWGAVIAGAATAAALSLILLILGVGLGLSTVSPWSGESVRAGTVGVSTIVWVILTQLLASALGGYLAGRLRVRWQGVHRDEVFFRDTAHGFLTWAVSSLATAALLTSTVASILGLGVQAGATVAGNALPAVADTVGAVAPTKEASWDYFIEAMFRRDAAAPAGNAADNPARTAGTDATDVAEVGRIFSHASRTQPLPPDDLRYVAQLVAQRTGLAAPEAEKRVSDIYARAQAQWSEAETAAKDAAEKARKASAYGSLWLALALLVGALVASWTATLGGQQRDN